MAAATAVVVAAVRTAAEGDIPAADTTAADRPAVRTAEADHTLGMAADQVRREVCMPRPQVADRNPAIPGRGKEEEIALPRVTVLRVGIHLTDRTAMREQPQRATAQKARTARRPANHTAKWLLAEHRPQLLPRLRATALLTAHSIRFRVQVRAARTPLPPQLQPTWQPQLPWRGQALSAPVPGVRAMLAQAGAITAGVGVVDGDAAVGDLAGVGAGDSAGVGDQRGGVGIRSGPGLRTVITTRGCGTRTNLTEQLPHGSHRKLAGLDPNRAL
jgi:hypothetical protein